MLYKLLLLTFLFLFCTHHISAADDGTTDVMEATPDVTDDGTDVDATDDGDETDVTDDGEDTDNDEGDDITGTDSPDGTDEGDEDTADDGLESNDTDGDTSQEDTDGSQSDDSTDNSVSDDDDDEDDCRELSDAQDACSDAQDADGDQDCGYNTVTGECYSIERRAGTHGSGNFDDGFNAAQDQAQGKSQQLETLVGVLGGIVGILVLAIIGGAYYLWNKKQREDFNVHRAVSMEAVDCEAPIISQTH